MTDLHVMIDIETLGTKPNAVVLSVAFRTFDMEGGVGESFSVHYPIIVQPTRVIDPSTAKWWMQQEPEALLRMAQGQEAAINAKEWQTEFEQRLHEALDHADHVWAKDPDFDCVILRDFYGWDNWPFWKHRSVRTMQALVPHARPPKPIGFVAHGAAWDTLAQVNDVMAVVNALKQKGIDPFTSVSG